MGGVHIFRTIPFLLGLPQLASVYIGFLLVRNPLFFKLALSFMEEECPAIFGKGRHTNNLLWEFGNVEDGLEC